MKAPLVCPLLPAGPFCYPDPRRRLTMGNLTIERALVICILVILVVWLAAKVL